MRSKHRYSRRRYSGRRRNERNRSRIAVLLIILFIIAVVIGSVFLGRYLKTKAEISESNRLSTDTVSDTESPLDTAEKSILFSARPPERMEAIYLPAGNISAFEGEGTSVSVVFRDSTGSLYYSSSVAQTLGGQSAENGLMSASDMVAALDAKNSYISAVFALRDHSDESGITTDAVHAFEQALIGEIAAAGVDEILLSIEGDMDAARVDMLCAFSETYRASAAAEVPVGLLIPYSFFSLTNANELCRALADHYEFLAVDYTDLASDEETALGDAVLDRIDTMQMYLSRYSLRVVIDAENADPNEAKAALDEAAVYSMQTVEASLLFGSALPEAADNIE